MVKAPSCHNPPGELTDGISRNRPCGSGGTNPFGLHERRNLAEQTSAGDRHEQDRQREQPEITFGIETAADMRCGNRRGHIFGFGRRIANKKKGHGQGNDTREQCKGSITRAPSLRFDKCGKERRQEYRRHS